MMQSLRRVIEKSYKGESKRKALCLEGESNMPNLVERTGIIHALDVEDKERALRIASQVRDYVDAIKISLPFALKYGLAGGIIREIKEKTRLPVLTCFKIGDIADISRRIMELGIEEGADGFTLHGFVGSDVIRECVRIGSKRGVDVYVVTEMSHPSAIEFMQPVGEKIARMAKELGATGIVAPATRPNRVRRYRQIVGNKMVIISPGVGPQGGKLGDAILEGANFEIIGHLIYTAPNPAEAARKISLELKKRLTETQIKV